MGETQSGSGVADELLSYNYDAAGNMTALDRYSDLAGSSKAASTTYGYDNASRLTGITDKTSGGTTIASYAYTLDAANRLTELVQTWADGASTDTSDYTYTNNDQLTGVTHTNGALPNESFSFDDNGNRNSAGDSTDPGNELHRPTARGHNYTYDANGNMVTKTDIATSVEQKSGVRLPEPADRGAAGLRGRDDHAGDIHVRRAGPPDRSLGVGHHDLDALRRHDTGARFQWLGDAGGTLPERADTGRRGRRARAGNLGRRRVVPDGSAGVGRRPD